MLITGPPWAALAFLDRVWASQDPASGLPGYLMPQEPVWWGGRTHAHPGATAVHGGSEMPQGPLCL